MAVTGSKLVASLLYDRYPELYWTDLPEAVRKIICTRIYQAPLPLFILITSGEGGDWSRLQLPNSNATSDSTVVVATEYSRYNHGTSPRVNFHLYLLFICLFIYLGPGVECLLLDIYKL